jgi:uncharacterized membrane protein
MSIGHLAAAVFAFSLQATTPPQDQLIHISIQVVDVSGARIPSAAIEVVSSAGLVNKNHADNTGEALFEMPRGTYEVTVSATAFQRKTETVVVDNRAGQVLEIKLAIDPKQGGYSGPVVNQLIIPAEHSTPLVQLPLAQVPLRVTVKDHSGAFIPRARIEVRSSESGTTTEIDADAQGNAVLHLDPGSYIASVQSPGFTTWRGHVDLQPNRSQSIFAELRIADGGGVQVTPDSQMEPERQILNVSIPLEALESLIDLPAHRLRQHGLTHLMTN